MFAATVSASLLNARVIAESLADTDEYCEVRLL
jgi:hypothetical protein